MKMSKFLSIAQALLNGLPDGWDIVALSKGESIHYYDTEDPWYVYAKSPEYYVELVFPWEIEDNPLALTEQMKMAYEGVINNNE